MSNEAEDVLKDKKNEARVNELMARATNKTKREVTRYFDEKFEDLDALDTLVLLAYLACDKTKSLEDLDDTPFADLRKVIGVEE